MTAALTVRLLVACACRGTSKLLWLAPSRVSYEESAVVRKEDVLNFVLGTLVNVLLVVSNQGLGNGLANGVNLARLAATLAPDTDVDVGKTIKAEQKDGLVDLEPERLGLDELDRARVNLYDSTPALAVGDSGSAALPPENLNRLRLGCHLFFSYAFAFAFAFAFAL